MDTRNYRRNLPHEFPERVPIFFTWRLHGSLPASAYEVDAPGESQGVRFRKLDRHLDRAQAGPMWLKDPRVASVVAEEIEMGASQFHRYELLEYVVMPNHVHLLAFPVRHPSQLMRWLKGSSARRANSVLGRSGRPFWQDESIDHWCRSVAELRKIREYIGMNPVKAGLVARPGDWVWSSAHRRRVERLASFVQRQARPQA